jgi:hypothetical protein
MGQAIAVKNVELMPQYQDLGLQPPSRLETVAQHAKQETDCNHAAIMFRFASDRESNGRDGVFGSDRGAISPPS